MSDKRADRTEEQRPRPRPKRPTRSQMRYSDYLHSDAGMSFREWMGFKRRRRPVSSRDQKDKLGQ